LALLPKRSLGGTVRFLERLERRLVRRAKDPTDRSRFSTIFSGCQLARHAPPFGLRFLLVTDVRVPTGIVDFLPQLLEYQLQLFAFRTLHEAPTVGV